MGDWEAVEQLIRCGADPDRTDKSGSSPLHFSVHGNSRCLKLLLCANADMNLKDFSGTTVLYYLSAYGCDTIGLDLLI